MINTCILAKAVSCQHATHDMFLYKQGAEFKIRICTKALSMRLALDFVGF